MNEIQILVVEDDLEICQLVAHALVKEGYRVDTVHNGADTFHRFKHGSYDLIVLDIMLPGMDGLEVLRRIREEYQVPVLILSAKDTEVDKILGLGLGADDYLTKPFLVGELLARVKANLRRYLYFQPKEGDKASSVLTYNGLKLDCNTFEVNVHGQSIPLTSKEFSILKLLMSEPQRVFTKSQIFEHVWDESYSLEVDDNTVMVHIRRLRTKIEADPSNPDYIQTVWGIGYRLSGKEQV
ncbi:response regulator transcription factor [Paenibacillus durus]|uniref:PhoP family transcriptional regulator n=1 Tax=Paenibacillus durus ATCC 35681 TaxID=1333534 RepID=A0A0F7FAJ9_PAEDU|nr:response regulator transcription factor [Paenibacillus durus]AKG35623.1 PhoP family transcriptional regulator [Paenibacillus durus ATCC 35681]